MLCRAKASSVSQVGLDAATNSVLFFLTGGVSFCSGVDAPEVLDSEPKVTPPSLVYTPSDLTSRNLTATAPILVRDREHEGIRGAHSHLRSQPGRSLKAIRASVPS